MVRSRQAFDRRHGMERGGEGIKKGFGVAWVKRRGVMCSKKGEGERERERERENTGKL